MRLAAGDRLRSDLASLPGPTRIDVTAGPVQEVPVYGSGSFTS